MLPFIPKSTPADEINAYLKKSPIWQHVQTVKLTINMIVQISGDVRAEEFSENLLRIGESTYPIAKKTGQIVLINELRNVVETPEQLINEAYSNIVDNYVNSEWLCERVILAMKNEILSTKSTALFKNYSRGSGNFCVDRYND